MKSLNMNFGKAMESMFRQIDQVVWDMMNNRTGIKTDEGIYTLGDDGQIEMNPFDAFSMELPAFGQLTPVDQIRKGDVIVSGGKAAGWVLEPATVAAEGNSDESLPKAGKNSITAISLRGSVTRFRPTKVAMMGVSNGIMVVRSPFNFQGEGKSDTMSAMLPLMMMSKLGGAGGGIDMKTMLMMQMMGGAGMGGMNPLMMLALLGDDSDKAASPFIRK